MLVRTVRISRLGFLKERKKLGSPTYGEEVYMFTDTDTPLHFFMIRF